MQTIQFRLKPTATQKIQILETLELCRTLYNTALEQRIFAYRKRDITIQGKTQDKELKALKSVFPTFKHVHSQVLQNVHARLDKAYDAFFRRVKNGETPGFPRFKGKNRYYSFTYKQSGFALRGNRIYLSKIGEVTCIRHRKIKGTIKTCTVTHKNGHFYVSLTVEVAQKLAVITNRAVGVDMGSSHLAITSEGKFFENPKHYRTLEKKLQWKQRAVSKKQKGSNRRKKAVAQLAKLHVHIANKRKDNAHHVSRRLVDAYDTIVFEELNIKYMVKNHHLAKSIHDAAWRMVQQFTCYKAENAGKQVLFVDAKYTSQECAKCGAIKKKTLQERTHKCPCGYMAHRDVNAAQVILKRGLTLSKALGAERAFVE